MTDSSASSPLIENEPPLPNFGSINEPAIQEIDATEEGTKVLTAEKEGFTPVKVHKIHLFLLALFVLFCYTGVLGQMIIVQQYVFDRFAREAGIPGGGMNSNVSVCNINKTDEEYIQRQAVQGRASVFSIYTTLASGLPACFMVLIYGAYSDRMGRKLTIIVPWVGFFVYSCIQASTIVFELKIELLIVGYIFAGLGGSYGSMLSGVFAFVADTTPLKFRSVAIGCFEAMLMLSFVISQVVAGWLIRLLHFKMAYVTMSVLLLSCILFVLRLPETVPRRLRDQSSDTTAKNPFHMLRLALKVFYVDKMRGAMLLIILTAFSIQFCAYMGSSNVTTLYLLNAPFCWDSVKLGYFRSFTVAVMQVGTLGALVIFGRRSGADVWLVIIGYLSYGGNYFLEATASTWPSPTADIFVFASSMVGMFGGLGVAVSRAIMSKIVTEHEQGVLFAAMASFETLSGMIGGMSMGALYEETVSFMPGLTLLVISGLSVLASLFMFGFMCLRSWRDRHAEGRELLIKSEDDPVA